MVYLNEPYRANKGGLAKIIQLGGVKKESSIHSDRLLISSSLKQIILNLKDVSCISADGNYPTIYVKNGASHLVSKTLKYYERVLSPYRDFIRVHKCHIVNGALIEQIENSSLIIIGNLDKGIPISRRNRNHVQSYLKTLIS